MASLALSTGLVWSQESQSGQRPANNKKTLDLIIFAGIAIDSMKKKKFYFSNSNTLVLLVITTNPRMDLFKHLCIQCNKKCPLIMIPSFM